MFRLMATENHLRYLGTRPELAAQDLRAALRRCRRGSLPDRCGNPLSFPHVAKPEIDLPSATDLTRRKYAKGKENFQRLI